MKKSILTGVAALTLLDISAGTADAQMAPMGPPDSWTGFYIGVHGGYRWGDADLTTPGYTIPDGGGGVFVIPPRSEEYNLDDGIIGGHIGFNRQYDSKWLIGVEADLTAGSGDDSRAASFVSGDGVTALRGTTVSFDWQATIRLRLGLTDGPLLYYATGGIAFLEVDWTETFTFAGGSSTVSKSDTLTGFVIGGGIEYAWKPHWILGGEILYEDFGDMTVPLPFTTLTGKLDDISAIKIRGRISYKF